MTQLQGCQLRRRLKRWFGGLAHLTLAMGLAGAMVLFVLTPVRVEGFSMLPRLGNDERLFVDKASINLQPLRRGDVVVFQYPRDPRENFIKRIIGLPGERLRIVNGTVYIGGRRLSEPYVPAGYRGEENFPEVAIPQGEFFVMGDHRTSSNDSRLWGCLRQRFIFGRAVFAYWPVGRFGPVH
jgi:signal peptidase I